MKFSLFDTTLWFEYLCMFISLCVGLYVRRYKNVPAYMRNFYWYSLVAGVIVILLVTNHLYHYCSEKLFSYFNNASVLFHFSFLSIFIFRILPIQKWKILFWLYFSTIFCLIIYSFFTSNLMVPGTTPFVISNLGLILLCLLYYYQLFIDIPTMNLAEEPSFWVIAGIFFCMIISIPSNSIREYILKHYPRESLNTILSLGHFSYAAMHLFFVYAYLISTRYKKPDLMADLLKEQEEW